MKILYISIVTGRIRIQGKKVTDPTGQKSKDPTGSGSSSLVNTIRRGNVRHNYLGHYIVYSLTCSLTSPKKTMSGFIIGTPVKGDGSIVQGKLGPDENKKKLRGIVSDQNYLASDLIFCMNTICLKISQTGI